MARRLPESKAMVNSCKLASPKRCKNSAVVAKRRRPSKGITADDMKKLRWIEPQLVAEVRFTEWTSYGLLRHATFAGLRDDKEPGEVTREQI